MTEADAKAEAQETAALKSALHRAKCDIALVIRHCRDQISIACLQNAVERIEAALAEGTTHAMTRTAEREGREVQRATK